MANKVAYHNTVIDTAGTGTLATITVYAPGTLTASTIYSDPAGTAKTNPFDTDAVGRFSFYADPGEYDIAVSGSGIVPYTLEDVSVIGDYTRFVTSAPSSGEYRAKKLRMATDPISGEKIILVTFDNTAEA